MKIFGIGFSKSSTSSEYVVEAVTWELKGGLYNFAYPIATLVLTPYNLLLRGSKSLPPWQIIHTGIVVHGYLYEYSTDGVKKTKATPEGDPGSACFVGRFLKREVLGTTNTSLKQFDTWIAKQKEGDFTKEKYCIAYNHCNHFAIKATAFLNVPPLKVWGQICNFSENNPKISKFARGSADSSVPVPGLRS